MKPIVIDLDQLEEKIKESKPIVWLGEKDLYGHFSPHIPKHIVALAKEIGVPLPEKVSLLKPKNSDPLWNVKVLGQITLIDKIVSELEKKNET